MHNFEIRICPLCDKVLQYRTVAKVSVYYCTTKFEMAGVTGTHLLSHYEVEQDKKHSIQHMYVLPYAIDNFRDESKSRVYRLNPELAKDNGVVPWKLVLQTSHIKADNAEKLLDRIQRLLTFS